LRTSSCGLRRFLVVLMVDPPVRSAPRPLCEVECLLVGPRKRSVHCLGDMPQKAKDIDRSAMRDSYAR
jgi:hypothetical protein